MTEQIFERRNVSKKLTEKQSIALKLRTATDKPGSQNQITEDPLSPNVESTFAALFQLPESITDSVSQPNAKPRASIDKGQENDYLFDQLYWVADYAGRVAHDFNNTLQILLSGVQFVMDDDQSSLSDESRIILNKVVTKLRGASDRIKIIRDFAGDKSKCPKQDVHAADLSLITRQVIELYQELPENPESNKQFDIDFETRLCPTCNVNANAEDLRVIVNNLITNACESISGNGTVGVTTSLSDKFGTLTVHDDGCGIEKDNMIRIFEPFWTTKKGKRHGTGLSTVYGLLRVCGGTILVTSESGKGTEISISIPLVD